jgi:hypothetical protein
LNCATSASNAFSASVTPRCFFITRLLCGLKALQCQLHIALNLGSLRAGIVIRDGIEHCADRVSVASAATVEKLRSSELCAWRPKIGVQTVVKCEA